MVPIFADTVSIKYLMFYFQWFSMSMPSKCNTEVDTWRKQNIFNEGLEFTKHCKYLLEKCS